MVSTKKSTIGSERVQQKKRTRRELLDAANRLLDRGEKPRLSAIAKEAEVSRATIYRYFPSEQALLIEATLDRYVPELELPAGETVDARVAELIRRYFEYTVDNEATFRRYLRAVIDPEADEPHDQKLRGGRRVEALSSLLEESSCKLSTNEMENLRCALAALTGIEALIVMKDICGLSTERGRDVVEWAARTLVNAALADSPPLPDK